MSKKLRHLDLPRNKHTHVNVPPGKSEWSIATRLRETGRRLQAVLA